MNKKFDLAKVVGSKWFGVTLAVGTAVSAFVSELASQKKEKTIEDLVKRVSELEKK